VSRLDEKRVGHHALELWRLRPKKLATAAADGANGIFHLIVLDERGEFRGMLSISALCEW